ncbi:MAG: Arm DNA-binding domain-containing protein [Gallionella sp.]|nr:Arm DNA-binding domain-containing protein [Gallionella sp.]
MPQSQATSQSAQACDGKGLYLEVKPSGVKAWRFRFKLSDKEIRTS